MPKKSSRATNCSYCGRMGHVEARCYHAHPELAPRDWVIRRPGQGRGQRRQGPRDERKQNNFIQPQPSRNQWVGTSTANGAPATKTNPTTNNQSGNLNAVTRDMTKLSVTDQGQEKTFRLMDLSTELVLEVLGHCDVLALTRLLRTSKLTKSLVESLEIIEEIAGNAKILGKLHIAVQRSKEHRKWSLPLDLSNWNPASILSSYKSEICPTCPPHEADFNAPEGWEEPVPHSWMKLVNATDGMYTCFDCFIHTPGYRLALDIEEFKQAEEWIHYRPDVGFAKNYLDNRVCRHGARLSGLQPIFLSQEGGPTFARISRNLWAKVRPFADSLGYDAREVDRYYLAEGCDKHTRPDMCTAPDDISDYDPNEI
ncbi:hypothetical protein PFICI_05677 [Pestalotiopsis fici W106-1]|uniref:F-box domain-containing protein n=1 Tax=Pestalotiopsis fici (strain W106-1 / CGMCC3.15140) TaxID=1229662 RepID=W3XF39_PESFW|nr:uncharacterized protein PFICI_05677 [Pestalotiopsis fici W106-1]ETS83801.1 hypothetical protein PFICI_05677 [Pestalotiopsis fici W106-1]